MHTVELIEQSLAAAQQLGYRVRHDWLEGITSGPCLIKGQKWLFLDLSDSPTEQLAILRDTLNHDPGSASLDLAPELTELLDVRRTA